MAASVTASTPPVVPPSILPIASGSQGPDATQKFLQWVIGCIPPEMQAAAKKEIEDFIEHLEKVGIETAFQEAKHVLSDTTENSVWNAAFQHNFDGLRK